MSDMPDTLVIKISNPSNLPLIDYRQVKPLQGDLKDLNETNYNKLKNVLIKRGFRVPLFLWRITNTDNADEPITTYYLMDGHQRQRVMLKENVQPYEVPYILIEAKTEAEAKAQLLEISSQYGTITQDGLDEFTAELPEADLKDLHFDRLVDFSRGGSDEDDEQDQEHGPSKPAIKIEFKSRDRVESALAELLEQDFTGRYDCEIKVLGEKE